MTERRYRLSHFILSEHESGALRFATHAALGMERSGNCYMLDTILVIGPWHREEHGYLIGEFHEQRERLPPWEKTEFFCPASALTDTATGGPPTEGLLRTLAWDADRATSATIPPAALPAGAFRLGGFRILVSEAGEISWQSCSGSHRLAEGPCRVESGVLLLGPRKRESSDRDGQEAHTTLAALPRWDRTPLWCRIPSLLLSTTNPMKPQAAPESFRPAQVIGRQERGGAVPVGSMCEGPPVLAESGGSAGTPTMATDEMRDRITVCLRKAAELAASFADTVLRHCREFRAGITIRAATLAGHARHLDCKWNWRRHAPGKKSWLALAAVGLLIGVFSAGYAAWKLVSHGHSSHENRHHD